MLSLLLLSTALQKPPLSCQPCTSRELLTSRDLLTRRQALLGVGCACFACRPDAAFSLAAIKEPDAAQLSRFATPRDAAKDKGFAAGMDSGMGSYEAAIGATKQRLFGQMLRAVPKAEPVVVELGMGTFPNAKFYATTGGPQRMDIVGVDPNDAMAPYAQKAAAGAGLAKLGHSVRTVNGLAEALPLADRSADAVVCTLTLCSVADPAAAVAEVRRVLRPGGQFLFVEHVLSPTDALLARQQRALTPLQVQSADGCHLDRETLQTVQAAGFSALDAEIFDLSGFWVLSPTAAGIAVS